jgi:tRNA threonylcarbamoyladenosine modification (KEOPS) complex Cgi121 subunit
MQNQFNFFQPTPWREILRNASPLRQWQINIKLALTTKGILNIIFLNEKLENLNSFLLKSLKKRPSGIQVIMNSLHPEFKSKFEESRVITPDHVI